MAGYCWNWESKKNKSAKDISFPEFNFGMQWNLASDGNLWIMAPESVSEIGCIHTCQGLEVDYVGVIVGDDFVIRDGKAVTNPDKRAKTDASLKGYKKELSNNPEETKNKADAIIKNTYRTLMTRGMKGCYVYFTDKETEKYFKSRISGGSVPVQEKKRTIPVVSPYSGSMINVPLFDSVGCGELMFADPTVQEMIPVKSELMSKGSKYFVLRTSGDSMNLAGINDGDLVLCRKNYHPEEGNNVVALIGDDATIKEYRRENGAVVLKPKSSNPNHKPLIFTNNDEIKVQGVVVCVLKE